MDKIVYTVLCADYFHAGHMNIIKKSRKLGKLIVGVMTDEAMASYKRVPMMSYEKRADVVKNIKGVWKVIPQHTLDYTDNLRKYKPNIVTNGDDWREGVQKNVRHKVIETLKQWNGKLIEIPYTKGVASRKIIKDLHSELTTDERLCRLKHIINTKKLTRVIEAHSGLSALIVEKLDFDAIWESSFTDSSSKGKPDIELVDFTSRLKTINEILEVSNKPMIVDLDTGGQAKHFEYMVKTLERLGVSAVVIEDKRFPKVNSLIPGASHIQETITQFCNKIKAGKRSQITEEFMIIARIESYIAGKNTEDAIKRAKAYIKAGADAILIHSKEPSAHQIVDFCKHYKDFNNKVPLVIVPTTYYTFREQEMEYYGIDVVIYANHLLRASYKAMKNVAEDIEYYKNCNVGYQCTPVKEIFELTNKKVLKCNQ